MDDKQVRDMLRKGMKQVDIARHFEVSKAAVSLRISRMKGVSVEALTTSPRKLGKKAVNQNLNAVDQLQRINDVTHKMLDELTGDEATIDRMVKAVEDSLHWDGNPDDKNDYITNIIKRVNVDKNTALRACAEIRGQLTLQMDIFKTLYSMKAIEEFQRVVLDAIKSAAPDIRDQIIQRLNSERLSRDAFKPPGL